MRPRIALPLNVLILAAAVAAPALAGFAGTDLFLPMAGRGVGAYPANWFTTVYLHNPNPTPVDVDLTFLERNKDNVTNAPPTVTDTLAAGETKVYENIVETTFGKTGTVYGAIRIQCASKVVATSRVYSKESASSPLTQSFGQDFAATPAAFAIGLGESTEILGGYTTQPYQDSEARFNIGCVETTGLGSATVHWVARDADGVERDSYDRQVPRLSQTQGFFHDYFTGLDLTSSRISASVTAGSGKVICYGSLVTNDKEFPKPVQDPTTFEMAYPARVLAEGGGTSGITGVTAGSGLTGGGTLGEVTLAVGAGDGITVTADAVSLAAEGVTATKIRPSNTVGQVLMTVSGGATAPGVSAMALGTNTVAWRTPAEGDITAVSAGTGLTGGGLNGAVTVGIANQGVGSPQLADGAVTKGKLSAAGGANGQVLGIDGSALQWQTPAEGDITGVTAGTGLSGGGASGSVTVGIANQGVGTTQLADSGVTSAKIANGTVASDDVGFNYASSTTKGGAASDVACTGCVAGTDLADAGVTKGKLSAVGGSAGQVLGTNGTGLEWVVAGSGDITAVMTGTGSGLGGGVEFGAANLYIMDNSITEAMLKADVVGSSNIKDGAVNSQDIGPDAVTTTKIRNSEVTEDDLKANAVTSAKILDGTITTNDVGFNFADSPSKSGAATSANDLTCTSCVAEEEILDGAVSQDKLSVGGTPASGKVLGTTGTLLEWQTAAAGDITSVTTGASSGLAGGVTSGDAALSIKATGVTNSMLAADAVTSSKIQNLAVTELDLAANAVTQGKLAVSGTPASGRYLGTSGAALQWQDAPDLALPYEGSTTAAGWAFKVGNDSTSAGPTIVGWKTGGTYPVLELTNSSNTTSASLIQAKSPLGTVFEVDREGDVKASAGIVADSLDASTPTSSSFAIRATNNLASGVGVTSTASNNSNSIAIYGNSTTGYAGKFDGTVTVTGSVNITGNLLVGGSKLFAIDHPLDPANRELLHAAVESHEVLDLYSGNVTTGADGRAVVRLPDWFEAVNADFRYQLTCVGQFAQAIVERKIEDNRFTIRTSVPGVEVSWQVTALRNDARMQLYPFVAEHGKGEGRRGTYWTPEAYGEGEEMRIERTVLPELTPDMR